MKNQKDHLCYKKISGSRITNLSEANLILTLDSGDEVELSEPELLNLLAGFDFNLSLHPESKLWDIQTAKYTKKNNLSILLAD